METATTLGSNLAEEIERVRRIRSQTGAILQPTRKSEPACEFCRDQGVIRLNLQVGEPGFGRLIPCPKCNTAADRIRRMRSEANVSDKDACASFHSYWAEAPSRSKALEACKLLMQRKGWLTLWGPYGNGKTYLGLALVNECLKLGLSARHYDMSNLLDFLRSGFSKPDGFDQRFTAICEAEVLVIDEANVFNATGWGYEKFRQICQARYRSSSKTITLWVLNPEPRVGNTEMPEGLDFLFSRMSEWSVINVDDGDVRPGLAAERELL